MKELFLFIHTLSLSEELGAEAPRFQESGRKPYGFRPYFLAEEVTPSSAVKEKRKERFSCFQGFSVKKCK